MLFDIFDAENIMLGILSVIIAFPALMFSLTIHEYAHGLAAYKQGDGFAKLSGRLTLNPFKHMDPIGTAFSRIWLGKACSCCSKQLP